MKCWIKIWFSIFLFTCQLIKIRSHNLLLFSYENISSFDALSQIYSPHTTYEKIFLILSYLSLGIFHDGFGTLKILLLNITSYYYWILNWGAIIVHSTAIRKHLTIWLFFSSKFLFIWNAFIFNRQTLDIHAQKVEKISF